MHDPSDRKFVEKALSKLEIPKPSPEEKSIVEELIKEFAPSEILEASDHFYSNFFGGLDYESRVEVEEVYLKKQELDGRDPFLKYSSLQALLFTLNEYTAELIQTIGIPTKFETPPDFLAQRILEEPFETTESRNPQGVMGLYAPIELFYDFEDEKSIHFTVIAYPLKDKAGTIYLSLDSAKLYAAHLRHELIPSYMRSLEDITIEEVLHLGDYTEQRKLMQAAVSRAEIDFQETSKDKIIKNLLFELSQKFEIESFYLRLHKDKLLNQSED